ncbi:MAG: Hpt domain-containing protein [Bacteroidota bacterium]
MSQKHILYIEDDTIDQMAFKRILAKEAWLSFTLSNSVSEGQKFWNHHTYDLVITDYHLSDGTAHDVLAFVRTGPIVVVTGTLRAEEQSRFAELGAKYYLAKPLIPDEFISLLREVLSTDTENSVLAEPSISFDLKYLKDLSQGDQEFEAEMIQIFLDEMPEGIQEIHQLIESQKWIQLGAAIHKMKSKIRLMGMVEIKDLADRLEKNFKFEREIDSSLAEIPLLVKSLEIAVEKASGLIPQL